MIDLIRSRAFSSFAFAALIFALSCFSFWGCVGNTLTDRSAVVINEVVSANKKSYVDEHFGSPDWIELYNSGNVAVDISDCALSDNILEPRRFVFPEGTVIPAGGYISVYCIADAKDVPEGVMIADFGLSKSGETLLFTDTFTEVIHKIDIPLLESDVSYAMKDDGEYGYSASPTYLEANKNIVDTLEEATVLIEPVDNLRFTEIVNGRDGWVELQNISNAVITLEDYYLTDDPAIRDKWRFPDIALSAGEYVVVELTGVNEDDTLNASFKVSKTESEIFLFNNMLDITDSLTFDPSLPDGVSAVVVDGTVCYTSIITKGEPNSQSTFPSLTWTDMDDSDPIRINELLPSNKYSIMDAEGDRNDWVELVNTGTTSVSLAGYYLSDTRLDPTKWALPDIELDAGEYLLIFLSGKDSYGDEIHAPFSISSTEEGIFLFTYDGMRVDSLIVPDGLNDNISIGRGAENRILYYASPTPGEPNYTYGFESPIGVGGFNSASVYVSEVSGVSAPRSTAMDWIELYNGSSSQMILTDWYITDDPDTPDKFALSHISIPAGGYAVINCSTDSEGKNIAPFGLGGGGETLYLMDSNGVFCDVFRTGVTGEGITSGRASGGTNGERVFFAKPTKGYANAEPLSSYVAEPVFSHRELYCTEAFYLTLTCNTEGASIYYTTNGSAPTDRSIPYTEPIRISENTVIRAAAFHEGMVKSPSVAHTYLFEEEHTVPVFCLAISSSDFSRMYTATQSETGGVTKGDEVPCHMEYYEDGLAALATGAGVRVSGASTAMYAQKSLGLYFRAAYGRSSVSFPFFEGCDVTEFASLTLRNGGQDASNARLRDSYMSRICQGLNIDVAYVQPVAVYINGSYWGLYDLKENLNEDYLAYHYGANPNDVEIIKRNTQVLAGSGTDWRDLRNFCVSYDFSNDANYARLAERVDVDSVIDYLIARTYFYDGDMFNQKYWRITDGTLKWRAVFFDSDFAMSGNSPSGNILPSYFFEEGVSSAHGSITNMDIFCALNQNEGWQDRFITRYIYVVKYVFAPENALPLYDELVEELAPEIPRQVSRWGSSMLRSYAKWEYEVSALRNCIESRQSYALRNLQRLYGLSDDQFAQYELAADAMYSDSADDR